MATVAPPAVQQLSFPEFVRWHGQRWEQGDHMTLIGPTKAGKSTLCRFLLRRRDYVTLFATKGKDTTVDEYKRKEGFNVQRKQWDGSRHNLIVLWPKGKTQEEVVHQQQHIFHDAIDRMYQQGGWCMYFDEVSYMTDFLGMSRKMRWLLQQSRSSGISVVAATQRPAFIPLAFYDQPEWLIFWNDNDETNLKRIQNIGGMNGRVIRELVQSLEWREILCLHTRHPHEMVRTKVVIGR